MTPIKDENPRSIAPIITLALIAANIVVFILEVRVGYTPMIERFGLVPSAITEFRNLETILTSMFLHGDFFHLAGNMLYLWIFGDNIESYLGHSRFVLFYLLCGLVAIGAHIYFSGVSDIPMVGASGAISGVLGGYFLKYPRARVVVVLPIFFFLMVRRVPAVFVLGFW
ncbi:rhomboid family intramembrane serine protease, partial [bacterium]|nr:rhomboid family intramembrane serine protease [bacterium]